MRKIKIIGIISIPIFLSWLFLFSYTNQHSISISRNILNGRLDIVGPGVKLTPPWVQMSQIDLRPMRVCVECSCNNVICNLVSFNKDRWKSFINKEGFRYYWWSNRISFNMGHNEEYRGVRNILRGYSLDNKTYDFLIGKSAL